MIGANDTTLSLTKKQKFSFRNANKRINLWEGSVRSGKTIGSILKWIDYVGNGPQGPLIMTGKTNETLYRNVLQPMQEFLGADMTYSKGERILRMWGREIFCFGANDERAENKIRGITCAGSYGDEITLWPESYYNMMLSRMSVEGAKCFLTTNPDNPNHWLKKKHINRKKELDMILFKYNIDDNIFLPQDYISNLKKEYVGLWYRRFIDGDWCIAEGAVYDFFDENIHCGGRLPKAQYYAASLDYGTNNPFSCGLYGINESTYPKIWRIKSYWYDSKERGRQQTDAEYSRDLREFVGDVPLRYIFVDPSAASFKLQLKKDGFTGIRNADNDVIDGIRTQATMLKNGEYMISKDKSNQPCIDEYYSYVWDEKYTQGKGIDKPLKTQDHSKDDERYILHTLFGKKKLDYNILTRM